MMENGRQALVESFGLLNYRAMAVRNGREALSLLAQYRDQIALELSDAVLPEMGGHCFMPCKNGGL